MLGGDPPEDVNARFDIDFAEIARHVIDNEVALWAMLRISLEAPARRGEASCCCAAAGVAYGSRMPYLRYT